MVHPDTDPTPVLSHIIDPVRDNLAQFPVCKVVYQGLFWLALRLPFATSVFEVPNQLFLLGVDGNDRQALTEKGLALRVDVFKLRIAAGTGWAPVSPSG